MSRRHGDTIYILPQGGASPTLSFRAAGDLLSPAADAAPAAPTLLRGIKAAPMLASAKGPAFPLPALQELAGEMLDTLRDPARPLDPLEDVQYDTRSVPAGYTYLGQFINHDLTFNPTQVEPLDSYDAAEIEQAQFPSFDLGCVYGVRPRNSPYEKLYKEFPLLRVGLTQGMFSVDPAVDTYFDVENDLPREGPFAQNPRRAVIADERNDDNLALAQTHVAFLRFHNRVVKLLKGKSPGLTDDQLFEAARKEVILCYQRIILRDYLPKVVSRAAYEDVLSRPLRFFRVDGQAELFLPLEFAAAAFRAGHSMVRNTYSWNRIFQPHDPPRPVTDVAELSHLFRFTGNGNMGPFIERLPTPWIIDWRRFYDFTGLAAGPLPPLNMARKIDTRLASLLSRMTRMKDGREEKLNLILLDLLAGDIFRLPSGQEAATQMDVKTPLSDAEIASGLDGDVLRKHGLDAQTPLWYYILKEAELRGEGERLGPVGSRIVAETIYGILQWSQPYSILRGHQSMPELAGVSRMADLIWIGLDGNVNPLG